jgi:hypothetical protein
MWMPIHRYPKILRGYYKKVNGQITENLERKVGEYQGR